MKKNIGTADKGIRVIMGIAIALLYYFNIISGTLALILMAVALILLITSFINFCPLYSIFKISTNKKVK
ncbi:MULTISPECIES: DUF2892 domain-containing protein [unclassified Algibacter]|uniref:YgaP family membrane protein n=1 Tax=unclassified Algibacter TaxID=2615009 RepID=UPI00131CCF46|nr:MULTISPECIES: DUF2892 domain-containing protein [unclassified Algibacter]MCL5129556.1 DUF2892 domain-containing protein [Algibacter sp. L4_22]